MIEAVVHKRINRRKILAISGVVLLAGCQVIPKGPVTPPPAPETPSAGVLPADQHLNPDLLDRTTTTTFEVVEPLLLPLEKARLRQAAARTPAIFAAG